MAMVARASAYTLCAAWFTLAGAKPDCDADAGACLATAAEPALEAALAKEAAQDDAEGHLELLQVRRVEVHEHAGENEAEYEELSVSDNASAFAVPTVDWSIGVASESCDVTCAKLSSVKSVMECNPSGYKDTYSKSGIEKLVQKAKKKCKKTTKASGSGGPAVTTSMMSGTTCEYHSKGALCSAAVKKKQLLCPCSKAIKQLQWRVGLKGESCSDTCKKAVKKTGLQAAVCDESALKAKKTTDNVKVIVAGAQPTTLKCTPKADAKMQHTPQVKKSLFGSTCYFGNAQSTCAGKAKSGNLRVCPCVLAGGASSGASPSRRRATTTPRRRTAATTTTRKATNNYPSPYPSSKPTGTPTWMYGAANADCNTVCRASGKSCVDSAFKAVDAMTVWSASSSQAKQSCSGTWENDLRHDQNFANTPAMCAKTVCKSGDPMGLCAVPKKGAVPSCSGMPPTDWKRMCPCAR